MHSVDSSLPFSRRHALKITFSGFWYFAARVGEQAAASRERPLAPEQPHFAPRAKRVILLIMWDGRDAGRVFRLTDMEKNVVKDIHL